MNNNNFEEIIHLYGRDILRFCRITACNKEAGDELYQETMLQLLEHIESLTANESIKNYAITTAIFIWKNKNRKFARRMRIVPSESFEKLNEEGYSLHDNSPSPEDIVIHDEEITKVRTIVSTLPEKYRLPLVMHYSANMQVKEIAKVLNLPLNTVKTRINRAKNLIKKEFESYE